jgi:hypothetical protein
MARRVRDITGRRFGKLRAEAVAGRDAHGNVLWRCACDCGGARNVRTDHLTTKKIHHCGCASYANKSRGQLQRAQPTIRKPAQAFTGAARAVLHQFLYHRPPPTGAEP